MGAGGSRKINKVLADKINASAGLNERSLGILYNRFLYLYIKQFPKEQHLKIQEQLAKKGLETLEIALTSIRDLKEF